MKFRECRKLKRGNTSVNAHLSLARFAGVVPLLLLLLYVVPLDVRGCIKVQRKYVWVGIVTYLGKIRSLFEDLNLFG